MIRAAEPADVPELMAMVLELAQFEDMADHVKCTEADLSAALFGPGAVLYGTVAVADDGTPAAYALWYRTFSTFLGKTGIWLEDIYVRPDHRRQGLGAALLRHLRESTEGRVEWEVLEWNSNAIDFYQQLGARPMAGWTKYRWSLQP